MKTVAVVGRKGGSGKSTLAVHLAVGAERRGRKTFVADIDPQKSAYMALKARGAAPYCEATSGSKLFALKNALSLSGLDLMIIDAPAVLEQATIEALSVADLALVVVRPTFLDLAALVRTSEAAKRLGRRTFVILNQAPPARDGKEPAQVSQARRVLAEYNLIELCPAIRSRVGYQRALAEGRSVEEAESGGGAAPEMAAACDMLDALLFKTAADGG